MSYDQSQPYTVGLHNVGSYQVSAVPYITGSATLAANSEHKLEFPNVTRSVTVVNHSSETIRIHFVSKDEGNVMGGYHYVELDSDEDSYTFNVKCNVIYVSTPSGNSGAAEYRVIAELTNIARHRMYALTGSGISE